MELLRDRRAAFEEAGVRVLGISRDSPWTHIAWAQALDLDFPLLSDWNAEAMHGFGIAQEHRGMRDVATRSAFLIDTGGTVRGAWRYGATELPDMDELVSAARGLSS
jgi:peroxiredoxin